MNSSLLFLYALLSLFVLAGCDSKQSAQRGAAYPSSYEGIWLARDILEFRKSKSAKIICDNIENDKYTGFKDELRIDGQVIDKLGHVFDFTMNESDFRGQVAMWRILNDGSTVDNIAVLPLDKNQCSDCENVVGLKVKKLDSDTMANSWTLRDKNGKLYNSDITYYRMSRDEMAEIKDIFEKCKPPVRD